MALVYSCCFWFSLRLGGILTGIFSIIQAVLGIIIFGIAYKQPQNIRDQISLWMKDWNLIYVNGYLENFQTDPEKFTSYAITISCIYILICLVYIYGAYVCYNAAMVAYILVELIRLITLSILAVTWLLILKQNTMDIGLVIGASVAVGFISCMFYLWVCAAHLPILINEIERDEQIAKIDKLQQLLENKNQRYNTKLSYSPFDNDENLNRRQIFAITRDTFPKPVEENGMRSYN